MSFRKRSGFSLIELLVVIAIISLLAAIVLPVFAAVRERGRLATCQSNLRQIGVAFQMYLEDYDGMYPCTDNLFLWQGRYWRWPLKPYLTLAGNPLNGNPLVSDKKDQNVLLCPSDFNNTYDGTSYAYSMSFYYSPDQINKMQTFGSTVTPPGPVCTPQSEASVAYPAQKALLTEWMASHGSPRVVGWYDASKAWEGARNYLFADGHVKFLKARQIRPANDNLPDINLTVDGIAGKDID